MASSSGWRRLLRLPRTDVRAGVEDEIAAHLALLTADLVAGGLTPGEARLEAEREFGAVAAIRDECIAIERRRRRRVNLSEALMGIRQDIRYTVRSLRGNRVFAIAAILCTALGVGATATIFSAVYATLVRPLPFEHPDEPVAVYGAMPAQNVTGVNISYPDYVNWRDESDLTVRRLERRHDPFGPEDRQFPHPLRRTDIEPDALMILDTHPCTRPDA